MSDESQEVFAARQDRFRQSLGHRRRLISERWIELRMNQWTRAGIEQLRAWVRELAEQSAEFGLQSLADVARELRNRVDNVVSDSPPFKEHMGPITAAVERVNLQIDQIHQIASGQSPPRAAATKPAATKPSALLAISDGEQAAWITATLQALGWTSRSSADIGALPAALAATPAPALLLIEAGWLSALTDDPAAAQRDVNELLGGVPWVLLTEHDDWQLRLQALQAGAQGCLSLPIDCAELACCVALAGAAVDRRADRILLCTDRPELGARQAELLQQAGLQVRLINELEQVLQDEPAQADLWLLDMSGDSAQREHWLTLFSELPGLEPTPMLCLWSAATLPSKVGPRCRFAAANTPLTQLPSLLRRTLAASRRETMRARRQLTAGPQTQAPPQMRSLLEQALREPSDPPSALLLVSLRSDPSLLRDPLAVGLEQLYAQLVRRVESVAGETARLCRHGSLGLQVLLPEARRDALDTVLSELARPLSASLNSDPARPWPLHVAALYLNADVDSLPQAQTRLQQTLAELQRNNEATRLINPPKQMAALHLPVDRMYLQVEPLLDARGRPQHLHDAAIHLRDADGQEQPLGSLIAEVVARGLAMELDGWEMHALAEHIAQLPDSVRGVEVAMRLSAASRESTALVPAVREVVAKLPPGRGFRLVFEVAESWLFEHNAAAVEMVQALRSLGCGVMLGDFGITDDPRNLGWAGWFDYARLARRRMEQINGGEDAFAAVEKLVRTAISRGARLVGGEPDSLHARACLIEWGVDLFPPRRATT